MQFIPWRHVQDWKCVSCGECCRLYSVVINFGEWLRIVKNYGAESTVPGLSELFIRRRNDGTCTFLDYFANSHFCQLQHMKPKACQLWPFKVLNQPMYGLANQASYRYGNNDLFVYIDSNCNGIRFGTPKQEFAYSTIREFVEIAVGMRDVQSKSTGTFTFPNIRNSAPRWGIRRF